MVSINKIFGSLKHSLKKIRALRKPFKILLLDEPFRHLDEKNQKLACDLILDVLKVNDAGLLLSSLGSAPPLPFNKTLLL